MATSRLFLTPFKIDCGSRMLPRAGRFRLEQVGSRVAKLLDEVQVLSDLRDEISSCLEMTLAIGFEGDLKLTVT